MNPVSKTTTSYLPHMPELAVGKTNRRVTKHFTNLPMYLPSARIALLNWLVYQIKADNTFTYSVSMLKQYIKSARAAHSEYGDSNHMILNIDYSRAMLRILIETGYILNTKTKNKFMLNPMLSYDADVINRKQYSQVCKKYQSLSRDGITNFTDYFTNLVAKYLESKKKNYRYIK